MNEPVPPLGDDVLSVVASVFANISQLMRVPLEATVGYRAQCEAAGFSPTAAEAMAEEFHGLAMKWLFEQTTGSKS